MLCGHDSSSMQQVHCLVNICSLEWRPIAVPLVGGGGGDDDGDDDGAIVGGGGGGGHKEKICGVTATTPNVSNASLSAEDQGRNMKAAGQQKKMTRILREAAILI